ncbi:MAG: glycosyltransferase family 1 protein [Alphaproteobacteria bacterium]|nr:glycosyltransferase family 1 protein [Alphaproteobacteria bacterium]
MLSILNIGIDRELLDDPETSEAVARQLFYASELPARIAHIVKAPAGVASTDRTLRDARVTLHPVSVGHPIFFPLRAVKRALAVARRERFDIVIAQEPILSGTAALCIARRLKLPLVVGAYNDQIANLFWIRGSFVNRLANRIGSFVYARAQAIRADSAAVAERLQNAGFRQTCFVPFLITHADKLLTPHADAAATRSRLLAGRSGPLLLTVARLVAEKNLGLMLRAVARIHHQLPDVRLVVVGDGPERPKLQRQALALGEAVQFAGRKPSADLPAYYQAADLFLLSSDIESSARVLSEAQLAGTPVLTTATAGAAEVVADGRTGRVVPCGDEDAFVQALATLAGDPGGLAKMRPAVARHAQSLCGREVVARGLRALYEASLTVPR